MRHRAMVPARRGSFFSSLVRATARVASTLTGAAAEFAAPSSKPSPSVPVEPAGLLAEAELPPVEEIAAAASAYMRAAEQGRAADRGKRAAKKLLDRLPAGLYGAWKVEREPSGRSTVDLEEVRRIFKRHNLGELPVKSAAPTLKVTRVQFPVSPELAEAEFSALVSA